MTALPVASRKDLSHKPRARWPAVPNMQEAVEAARSSSAPAKASARRLRWRWQNAARR